MARPTNKERLELTIKYFEVKKMEEFISKFSPKTLNYLALKLGVRVKGSSKKNALKHIKNISRKTQDIQEIWRILIND